MDALWKEHYGKASSQSYFSLPPPPARKPQIRFSLPLFVPDLVSSTQYDYNMERDSLALHSSCTQRKRLIVPRQIIAVKLKSSHSKEEALNAFTKIMVDELAKASPCDDVCPSEEELDGFEHAHVSRNFL